VISALLFIPSLAGRSWDYLLYGYTGSIGTQPTENLRFEFMNYFVALWTASRCSSGICSETAVRYIEERQTQRN
jgi:hypothetical protein